MHYYNELIFVDLLQTNLYKPMVFCAIISKFEGSFFGSIHLKNLFECVNILTQVSLTYRIEGRQIFFREIYTGRPRFYRGQYTLVHE